MAQFGANVTETNPIGVASTVKEGVREAPSTALQVASNVFEVAGGVLENRQQSRQEAYISEFTSMQLGIIQATDQGTYKPQYARTLLRKNLIEALNNYPALREQLIQANSGILGTAGMGQIVNEQDRDELERERARNTLIDNGLLAPGASDEQFVGAYNNWTRAQEAARIYEAESKAITLERAKIGLSSDQITLLNNREERAAQTYLVDSAPAELQSFQGFTRDLIGRTDLTQAEKLTALENQWIQMQAQSAQWEAKVGDTFATAMRKTFEQHKLLTERLIKGELSQEEVLRQNAAIEATIQNKMLQDPRIASFIVLSKAAPNMAAPLSLDVQTAVAEMFILNNDPSTGQVANPLAATPTERQGLTGYFKHLFGFDTQEPEQAEQLHNQLESLMLGIEDYQSLLARDPKSGIALMDQMADPAFLELIKANPDIAAGSDRAREVIAQNYSNEVWGMVQREFTNSNVITLGMEAFAGPLPEGTEGAETTFTPTPDAVTFRSTTMGVEFLPIDPTNADAASKARRLNRELAPVINRTVKATAHLEGRSDYGKVFEEAAQLIFGSKSPDTDIGDELSIEDWRAQQEPQLLLSMMDRKESGGKYDTLLGFSNRNEFSDVDVTTMTLEELFDFSSANGAYGRWTRQKLGYLATPMGRYQIVGQTLRAVANEMGLPLQTVFTPAVQDSMFNHLMEKALSGKSSMADKRQGLRSTWAGFRNVTNAQLDAAIMEYENAS